MLVLFETFIVTVLHQFNYFNLLWYQPNDGKHLLFLKYHLNGYVTVDNLSIIPWIYAVYAFIQYIALKKKIFQWTLVFILYWPLR